MPPPPVNEFTIESFVTIVCQQVQPRYILENDPEFSDIFLYLEMYIVLKIFIRTRMKVQSERERERE